MLLLQSFYKLNPFVTIDKINQQEVHTWNIGLNEPTSGIIKYLSSIGNREDFVVVALGVEVVDGLDVVKAVNQLVICFRLDGGVRGS